MKRRINLLCSIIRLRHENGAVSVFPAVFIMFLLLLIFTVVISIVIVIIIIVYCVCEFGNM